MAKSVKTANKRTKKTPPVPQAEVAKLDHVHAIKPKRKKFGARKVTWDHKHQLEKVSPYEFETAGQLLEDFWEAVEGYLGENNA